MHRGCSLLLEVAEGMLYLHNIGIVHLDIKSPNILLSSNGHPKLADVGLAKMLQSKTHLSSGPHE